MSLIRRNPARDGNEAEIIAALERLGVSVQPLSGRGIPDLLWGWQGRMGLIEVKNPEGRAKSRKQLLTKDQARWWGKWRGPLPRVVKTVEEAVEVVTGMREFNGPQPTQEP